MKMKHIRILLLAVVIISSLGLIGCRTTDQVSPIEPAEVIQEAPVIEPVEVAPVTEGEVPVAEVPVTETPVAVPPVTAPAEKQVTIITTSDMHGSLFPYDFMRNTTAATSQMHVSSYVNEQRAKDQTVVLLDNGDVLQGQPLVYYYNFVRTDVPHMMLHRWVITILKLDQMSI